MRKDLKELTLEQIEKVKDSMILVHRYNDPVRMKFMVPIKKLSKAEESETISNFINDYREEISFDDKTCEIKINSSEKLEYAGKSRIDGQDMYHVKDKDFVVKIIDGKDLYIKPTLWQRFINFFKNKYTKHI